MLIKSRNDKDEVSITLNGHTVESTNKITLLGVNIDEHLVFSKHISDICVKASQRIGVLGRLRNLIPTEAKLLLYKTSIKNSPYCLRNRNFSIPTYNTVQYGKHSLRYLGPHIWSKLDKADKERPTLCDSFVREETHRELRNTTTFVF